MEQPPQVYARAVDALNRGDWEQAWTLSQALLGQVPGHGGVHFVAGVAALQARRMPQALAHLREAVRLSPDRADYGAQLARALADVRLTRESVEAADAAASAAGEAADPMTLDTLGVVYTQGNQHAKAAALFRRAASRMPGHANYRFNLATSLTFLGDTEAAEREYEACLAIDPHYWKAHLALAQLRRQAADANHLDRLRGLLGQGVPDAMARMYLNLALAKELEDLAEYPAAFDHLVAGKAAGKERRGPSRERDAAVFDALERAFPGPLQAVDGSDSAEPVFVIGMPRTGTTLVDRILSSHPQVQSAGELQNFGVLLKRASGSRTPHMIDPDTIARSRSLDWRRLGDAYVASTRPGTGQRPRFIDKLPHNFLYAAHIAMALPSAKIVCLRRDPMDTCLGNFRQLFAQTSPYYDYSFDLLDTGHYYLRFDRLMAHWQAVMPGRILELQYEALVGDQEGQTRRLLEFCGLPWDPACLRFEENEAPVATASAVQVRSALHGNAIGRWKRYEAQLAPLRELLASSGVAID